MRIAQVAPLTEAVPPKLYGGTERVVHWLTEELVALGHDVTLFASGDSHTSARLDATWPKALRLDGAVRDPNALHMVMLERVRRKCDDEEFDFLHFHLDYYPFSLFSRQPTPFLTTLHGRLDLPEHQPVFTTFSSTPVVSISNAQRRPVPQANWLRTIHHGLPKNLLTPQPTKPGYLAVLGRIAPEKGVDRAIRIAIRCGIPLKIAAKVDRADQEYYDEMIKPMMTLRMTVHSRFTYGSSNVNGSAPSADRVTQLGEEAALFFARECGDELGRVVGFLEHGAHFADRLGNVLRGAGRKDDPGARAEHVHQFGHRPAVVAIGQMYVNNDRVDTSFPELGLGAFHARTDGHFPGTAGEQRILERQRENGVVFYYQHTTQSRLAFRYCLAVHGKLSLVRPRECDPRGWKT